MRADRANLGGSGSAPRSQASTRRPTRTRCYFVATSLGLAAPTIAGFGASAAVPQGPPDLSGLARPPNYAGVVWRVAARLSSSAATVFT